MEGEGVTGMRRLLFVSWLAILLVAVPCARAQRNPHIGYIFPAGAQQGSSVEITVGGENLVGTREALISGGGIDAKVIGHAAPFSERQLSMVNRKMQEIGELRSSGRKGADDGPKRDDRSYALMAAKAADEFRTSASMLGLDDPSMKGYSQFRKVLANPKRQPNAQISETVTLYLTLSPGARPGERELRLRTPSGVTNPLYFQVGNHREYREREPNDQKADDGVLKGKVLEMEVSNLESLPVVLNGQIMPGDVDRFRFDADKGTRLVADVSARSLVPYLADAVPGWFQATLALSDAEGNEVAYADDFRFAPDPVIHYEIPESGEYVLEIKDSIYRGREDFVYRIALGEAPFLTSVFPLGGRAGTDTRVKLEGWNLPVSEATLDTKEMSPGIRDIPIANGRWVSRGIPFAIDTLPECLETEPNNEKRKAQSLVLPMIVNGRIDRSGDWDVFRFKGRAGEKIAIEVLARRLGSPLDSLLKLFGPDGKMVAANDDHIDKWLGLLTHYSDSFVTLTLPDDGLYLLRLSDTQNKGGAAYSYRLRVSAARPDFDLRVVPSTVNAPAGATVPFVVHAMRKDGFEGDISLGLKGMPKGFALGGGRIPSGCDQVRLTLTIPARPPAKTVSLRVEGDARIDGKEVRHLATPAEDMMQAFLWRHLVPMKSGTVAIAGRDGGTAPLKRLGQEPVKLSAIGTARVRFALPSGGLAGQVKIELDTPPKGIAVKDVSTDDGEVVLVIGAELEEPRSGMKGNLILNAFLETTAENSDGKPTTARSYLGMLPAVPFEVIAIPST
jgi:hypothetical protein